MDLFLRYQRLIFPFQRDNFCLKNKNLSYWPDWENHSILLPIWLWILGSIKQEVVNAFENLCILLMLDYYPFPLSTWEVISFGELVIIDIYNYFYQFLLIIFHSKESFSQTDVFSMSPWWWDLIKAHDSVDLFDIILSFMKVWLVEVISFFTFWSLSFLPAWLIFFQFTIFKVLLFLEVSFPFLLVWSWNFYLYINK